MYYCHFKNINSFVFGGTCSHICAKPFPSWTFSLLIDPVTFQTRSFSFFYYPNYRKERQQILPCSKYRSQLSLPAPSFFLQHKSHLMVGSYIQVSDWIGIYYCSCNKPNCFPLTTSKCNHFHVPSQECVIPLNRFISSHRLTSTVHTRTGNWLETSLSLNEAHNQSKGGNNVKVG